MSIQQTQIAPAWPAAAKPETRASDADRDAAAGLLNAAFADGRLTAGEHEERLSAAYAARTWQQLGQLTADLPAPPAASGQAAVGMFARADLCLLCVLLVACPPAGIAWLFFCWHRARTDPNRRLPGTGDPALLGGR